VAFWEGDDHSGPEGELSLLSHAPGEEAWITRLEQSICGRSRDDDGLAGELALIGL